MRPLRVNCVPAHQPRPVYGACLAALAGILPVGMRGLPPQNVPPQQRPRRHEAPAGQLEQLAIAGA